MMMMKTKIMNINAGGPAKTLTCPGPPTTYANLIKPSPFTTQTGSPSPLSSEIIIQTKTVPIKRGHCVRRNQKSNAKNARSNLVMKCAQKDTNGVLITNAQGKTLIVPNLNSTKKTSASSGNTTVPKINASNVSTKTDFVTHIIQ